MAYTITNKQRTMALTNLNQLKAHPHNQLTEREQEWLDTLIGYLESPMRNYYKFEDEELSLLQRIGLAENDLGIS